MTTAHAPTPATAHDPTATLGRAAAALALATAAVHLLLLRGSASTQALVMAAMALACLPCAWHLWRSPTVRVWAVTAALDAAMGGLHLRMLGGHDGAATGGEPMAGMAHAHDAAATGSGLMWLALALVAAQLAVAATASLHTGVRSRKPAVHAATPAVTHP